MANISAGPQQIDYVFGLYIDEPLAIVGGGATYYYHQNNLHCLEAITNAAAAIVELYAYNAYGQARILAPDGVTVLSMSSIGNPFTYTGRRLDPESGLYYYRARYYDGSGGRFIGRDSIGFRGGLNLYRYVGNAPTIYVDPAGLDFVQNGGNCRTRQIDISHQTDTPFDSNWMTIGSVFGVPIKARSKLSFYWRVTGSVQQCDCCNKVTGRKGTTTQGQVTVSGSNKLDVELGAQYGYDPYFEIFLGGFATSTGSIQGSGSVKLDDCNNERFLKATFEGQEQWDAGVRGRITGGPVGVRLSGIAQAGLRGVASVGGDLTCSGPTCALDVGMIFKGGGVAQYSVNVDFWGWSVNDTKSASFMFESRRMGFHETFANPL